MLSKAGILQLGNYFIALLRIDSPFQGAGFRLQKPLNPSRLQRHPLPGAHGLRYASAGTSIASISFRNLADTPVRRVTAPGNLGHVGIPAVWHPHNHLGHSIPLQ